jgi:hypothetical protein
MCIIIITTVLKLYEKLFESCTYSEQCELQLSEKNIIFTKTEAEKVWVWKPKLRIQFNL